MQRILDVKRDQKRCVQHLGGERLLASTSRHEGEQAAIRKAQCGGASSGARRRVEDSLYIREEPASEHERFEGEGRVMAQG